MLKQFSLQFATLSLFTLLLSANVNADIILTVDISDPSAVIFTTTDAFADGNFDGLSVNGITLKDFFDGNTFQLPGQTVGGSIAAISSADGSTRENLTGIWVANFGGGFTPNDVAFYDRLSAGNAIFSFDSQRALTGSAVFDLTPFEGLPTVGTIGNVHFDNPDRNQILGQWQVINVPEPSTTILLAFGSVLVLLRR